MPDSSIGMMSMFQTLAMDFNILNVIYNLLLVIYLK